jgi:hypothetical protein
VPNTNINEGVNWIGVNEMSLFSGVVHWSGSRVGLNGRTVYVSYFFKLLLFVMGLGMTFHGSEGVCVFLNVLSEVQFSNIVYK